MVYRYLVFFFVIISRTHNTINQIPLIRHQKQSFRILIQSSYRIYSQWVIQIFCHRCFLPLFLSAAYNSSWFVKQKDDLSGLCRYRSAIQAYNRIRWNSLSCSDHSAVYRNSSGICKSVCVSPGTDSDAAQIFVDPNCVCIRCRTLFLYIKILYIIHSCFFVHYSII